MKVKTSFNDHDPFHVINGSISFNEYQSIHKLKHYLPAQAPLKDFVHHNTLHAFQHLPFHHAIQKASEIFGYKVSLSLEEYRQLYNEKRIHPLILNRVLKEKKGEKNVEKWVKKMLEESFPVSASPRIGVLRSNWKKHYHIDLDSLVHPILFRILCSYLDQGISMWHFPVWEKGFLTSLRELEKYSFTSFFKTDRAKQLLLQQKCQVKDLLKILVGDESLYEQYLFDQQFAHQGWSGIVSAIEEQPGTLLDPKKITLAELIYFELLLEIDALDAHFRGKWEPLRSKISNSPVTLFTEVIADERNEVLTIWQEAFEWTYYDQVLFGIKSKKSEAVTKRGSSFQAMFCIDDRECSLRRYLESLDSACETYATPGFFSVEFFFQPENGNSYSKQCPAPVKPKYLIKETGKTTKRKKDAHFAKHTHTLFRGWLITHTLGFWSALKLFLHLLRPSMSPATAHSFDHMDRLANLTIENKDINDKENGLQIGFTVEEMAIRVEALLRSIGLITNFAPLVYVVGHGSSSVNNPHYAAYDCGACSGRPGSVNARVFSFMANHPKVREILRGKDIIIPMTTQFVGGIHDTTRDDVSFFDESFLSAENKEAHQLNQSIFDAALDLNAKERSRRFDSINTNLNSKKIHEKIRQRSVSLFEPRPELNHATNALCIVGRRGLTKELFLDRRAFMNSYDYTLDTEGQYLLNILKAAAPVCGGINLEYYFSRVDNQKLGAGTKLPHNVMGLFGVANGIDGDLRPGLPSQMIEVHDPIRLLMIVEHRPEVVLKTIQSSPETYEWFLNEWVHLVVFDPETEVLFKFKEGAFFDYQPLHQKLDAFKDLIPLIESNQDNLPVHLITN